MSKRIFISFAIEDQELRSLLRGQGRNPHTPFAFTDMSVKEPSDDKWKARCRTRIKGCDGVVAIITKNTAKATGQLWEINCAYTEGVPVYPIYGSQDNRPKRLPAVLSEKRIYDWSWPNIANFIDRV